MKSRGLLHRSNTSRFFGPNFKKDVKVYQRRKGLKNPTGIPGPAMLKELGFKVKGKRR